MSCKDCDKRAVGCHGKCKDYLDWVEKRKEIYRGRLKTANMTDYIMELRTQELKRSRWKGDK